MFTLAHLSDLHLALTPKSSELASKRGLGYINWQRKRKYIHSPDVLTAVTRHLQARAAEHVVATGHRSNFSLPGESLFSAARRCRRFARCAGRKRCGAFASRPRSSALPSLAPGHRPEKNSSHWSAFGFSARQIRT